MVVGFNHNFRYKGEVYHIQTEDSGVKSPNIVTLLYQGGTILASKKTSYADIAKVDNLDQVVEELMKEQHKEMLRSLKAGEFDAVIERFQVSRTAPARVVASEKVAHPPVAEKPLAAPPPPPRPAVTPVPPVPPAVTKPAPESLPSAAPAAPPAATQAAKTRPAAIELSLDEVILSYLMGDDK